MNKISKRFNIILQLDNQNIDFKNSIAEVNMELVNMKLYGLSSISLVEVFFNIASFIRPKRQKAYRAKGSKIQRGLLYGLKFYCWKSQFFLGVWKGSIFDI